MYFSDIDKTNLMKFFPNIELSYEKKIHKKVNKTLNNRIYLTIPKGNKFFAWFVKFKNKKLCVLLSINKRKNTIVSIKSYNCVFDTTLTSGLGTILYGTIFHIRNFRFFNIEDMFTFRGKKLNNFSERAKLDLYSILMENYLKQTFYTKNSIIFGLPIISEDYNYIKNTIDKLPYELYAIQSRTINKKGIYYNNIVERDESIEHHATFLIKPTINTDIYDLFYLNKNYLERFNVAHIPDFKTSVMMNKLFRTIKENNNLDLLEESDDDEEFEDISLDKYVDLNKKYKMKCVYNKRFERWIPLSISEDDIIDKKTILSIKKK